MTMGDEECFEIYKDMVYPIVKGWHGFDPYKQYHKSVLNEDDFRFSTNNLLQKARMCLHSVLVSHVQA